MNPDELAYLSATEQARLIAKRDISPVDLTRAYLERIERWEPTLHEQSPHISYRKPIS